MMLGTVNFVTKLWFASILISCMIWDAKINVMVDPLWKSWPFTVTTVPMDPDIGLTVMDGFVAANPKLIAGRAGKTMIMLDNRRTRIFFKEIPVDETLLEVIISLLLDTMNTIRYFSNAKKCS